MENRQRVPHIMMIGSRPGSSDVSRGARPPSSSLQQRRNSVTSSRPISASSPWRHVANDDSAVYRRSKGSLSNIMRASRPQRGESFSVGKSRHPARPLAAGAPPWPQSSASLSTPHHATATTPTSLTASSSIPTATHLAPAPSFKASDFHTSLHDPRLPSDRHRHRDFTNRDSNRQPENDTNHLNTAWNRGWDPFQQVDRQQDRQQTQDSSGVHIHSRPHPMVSSKSSPNLLNKGDPAVPVVWGAPAAPDRSVSRSVSSIPDDLPGEGEHRRSSVLEQQAGEHGAAPRGVDSARDRVREAGRQTSHQHTSTNRHDQLHRRASGMNIPREAPCAVSHSVPNCNYQPVTSNHQSSYKPLPGYQPDLHSLQKNQPQNSVLTSRPNSYSVPNCNPDSHIVQNYCTDIKAAPASQTDYGNRGRDSRCVAVNSVPGSQTYENVTLLASASLKKEQRVGEGSKGRDGLPLPSRPYSGVSDDGHGSGVPTPSLLDPSSLQYNKVPRSQEKCPPWPQNPAVAVQSRAPACTDPGNTPREMSTTQAGPRPSLDGSLGMQRSLPENMKAHLEDFRQSSLPGYLPPRMDLGGGSVTDKGYNASCASARDVDGVGRQLLSQRLNPGLSPTPQSIQSHSQRSVPGSFPPPCIPGDTEREDKSTSPLASPRYSLPSPGDRPSPTSRSPSPRDRPRKDFAVASTKQPSSSAPGAGKGPSKGVIVRSTPYYNTSTQTELSAYALKTSDPRGVPQCSVQIQVDEADKQRSARKDMEEKSIQARMSREFLPSDLDATSTRARKSPDQATHPDLTGARKAQCDEKSFFQFPFEGMKSIQEKYGMGEEVAGSRQDSSVFSCVETGDQASIMRQLSEEFYRGNRGAGDKPHLPGSHLDQAFRPLSSSSLSAQLSSSQPSVADPHHDPSAGSRSSLRPGGPHQQDHFSRSSPRPLQESKKFKSLSAISHQREASVPVTGRSLAQSHESLSPDTVNTNARRPPSESGRDSGGMFQPPSPSPRNSCSESGSHKPPKVGAFPSSSGASGGPGPASASRHSRTQSVDSVLSDRPTGSQRDRAQGDNSSGSDGVKKTNGDMVGRKPSMKMAYGIYDDSDVLSLTKDSPTVSDATERSKVPTADAVQLGQIREEGGSLLTSGFKPQRPGELTRHKTHGDISDPAQDSWRDDLNKRTGLFQNRASSELILTPRDRSAKMSESFSSHRPPRLFDGSIDSGVGSEISCRADGVVTPSETPRSPLLPLDNPTGLELKQIQQQAVLNFLQRKTGIPFHSPESSVCDSTTSTPRGSQSQSQSQAPDPVSALISKTNANLARRADSLRRTSSVSSRASSAEQVEVSRSRKETEWSRLRSSGSFNYGSDRSSLCSDNTYEDISVFGPATPRGSLLETPRVAEDIQNLVTHPASQDSQRSNTDSGVMASTTAYQNIPGPPPRRRPPPPPPRSPSPEPGPPPALPPRNYGPRKEEGAPAEGEVKVDESKVDFKTVLQQCRDKLSPREDAYTAQLRKLDVKFSGLRGGSSPSTPPTSMSVLHSRTPTGISTSYKRQPTVAQEATTPGITTVTSSISLTPSVSSSSSNLGARASSPHHLSQDLHLESHFSVSLSSQTKDSPSEPPPPVKVVVDRDTKPVTAPVSSAKPPQLPERAAPPPAREQKPASSARADLLPPRSEGALPKDRTVPDFHAKVSNWKFLPPPEVPRDRKLVDSHVVLPGKTDSGSASPSKDSSRSPAGKRRDVPPPPSPGKDDHDGVGVVDPSHLPPPPPELLSDSEGHFGKGEQEKTEPFADDSYGAYRNRGSRQVGTYKRSSSAALLRPDNQHLKAATDAHAVFGDRRLGNQAWNSDSQLQASRRADAQQPDGGGAPQQPPDRAGNPPAEGGPARSVGRVSGVVSSAPGGRGRDDGKVFTAHPFRVESRAIPEKEVVNSYDSAQPSRLLKETSEKTVTSSSLNSQTAGTPNSSSGQRWANAIPFPTTHRVAADDVKSVNAAPSSPHNHRGPPPRPAVTPATDCQQSRDRPSGSALANSTHNPAAPPRSRVLSDRSRHGDVSPTPDSRQRYAEVAPFASEARGMPGHVRTVSQSSDPPRPAPSPYSRRESAPPPHIPPEAIAMVSPRRKSEDLLTDPDKESCVADEQVFISHGRQPSQEELECDQRAKELAMEVADSEKKLSDVLNADNSKKRMEYMDGLFSVPVEVDVKIQASVRRHQSHSAGDMPSFRPQPLHSATRSADEEQLKKRPQLPLKHSLSSPGGVVVERTEEECSDSDRNAQDNDAIVKHKEEVMEKLQKKLELLKEEKKGLQEEIDGNKALGKRVSEAVDSKCSNPSERDKFHTYVSDLEKIVRLLLNLSGQLARAENAVQALGNDTDPDQKKRAVEKCEGLRTKYLEAKQLKDHMDKRSDTVSAILRQSLSGQELKDYSHFISLTSTLTIHLQQLEDEITLGQEQIVELRKSMSEQPAPSSPLTPSPVPVSS